MCVQMRKINFRVIFFGVASFILALVFARHIFALSVFHIIFALLSLACVLVLCIKFKCIKRFVIIICFFVFGVGYYALGYYTFMGEDYKDSVVITARVQQIIEHSTYTTCVLDDVQVNGKDKPFCITASIDTYQDFSMGNIITFEGKLTKVDLFKDNKFNSYYYKNGTNYKTTISDILTVKDGYLHVNEKVSNFFGDFVDKNFDPKIGGIVKSVVFGDKSTLDDDVKNSFSSSGIAHLLAISGLHISIIISMINFILKKFKLKQIYNFIILLVVLSLYCYLCNFAPSVVRASLMSLVFLFASLSGRKYDRLNSLAICAFLILLFKPLYIFDAGFLLSFGCVFCIFVLSSLVRDFLKFLKIGYKLCDSLAIILGVQIGLIPLVSLFYTKMNVLSIICNLICVPLFEIAFILTFIFSIICLILPFTTFILKGVEFLYWAICGFASIFTDATFAYITMPKTQVIYVTGFYSSCFVASKFVQMQKIQKLYAIFGIIFVSVLCSIFA